jgi:hypothetical protein
MHQAAITFARGDGNVTPLTMCQLLPLAVRKVNASLHGELVEP